MKQYIMVLCCAVTLCASCRGLATQPSGYPQPVDIRDSLEVREGLGPVVERTYASSAASATRYVLTLYNQEHFGGGVFRLTTAAAGNDGPAADSYGTWFVLRGDAADPDATVYQLLPYAKEEPLVNLLYVGDSLVLLDATFRRAVPRSVWLLDGGE